MIQMETLVLEDDYSDSRNSNDSFLKIASAMTENHFIEAVCSSLDGSLCCQTAVYQFLAAGWEGRVWTRWFGSPFCSGRT
ncbi:hypothetical protein E2C01_010951 [Portunus trituberculatus]|uniref:Uncharacterized protein n=1 Tax=Portunus trituberculatus TaxID=210409 RepID=A0A5B7D9Z8_PORTR|nr:hypothetical protein [Portunus trituberculatus]